MASTTPRSTSFNNEFPGLHQMDWIGFDLDHALVRYDVPALMEVVYKGLSTYMIGLGYSAAALDKPFDASFCGKGVVYEFRTGCFLKLTSSGRIAKAFHGTRPMTDKEIVKTWAGRVWPGFNLLKRHARHDSFFVFLTYFDMPAQLLLARLVDEYNAKGSHKYDFIPDLFAAFNHEFDPSAFHEDRGLFFPTMRAELSRMVRPRKGMKEWLQRMRAAGKHTMLCTNSHIGFATMILEEAFGTGWEALFDVRVFKAEKPGFFYRIQPFAPYDLATLKELPPAEVLSTSPEVGTPVIRGNAAAIQHLADAIKFSSKDRPVVQIEMDDTGKVVRDDSSHTHVQPIKVNAELPPASSEREHAVVLGMLDALEDFSAPLTDKPTGPKHARFAYIGDHLHGDVLAPRRALGWHTIAIVEELELYDASRLASASAAHSSPLVCTPQAVPTVWGDFFAGAGEHDPVSYFGHMTERASCLAVSDSAVLQVLYPFGSARPEDAPGSQPAAHAPSAGASRPWLRWVGAAAVSVAAAAAVYVIAKRRR